MTDAEVEKKRREALRLLGVVCQKCKKNAPAEPHSCPFASEINDDRSEDYCQCCQECADECAADI